MDSSAGPNLWNKDLHPCSWTDYINPIKPPPLKTVNTKVVNIKCILDLNSMDLQLLHARLVYISRKSCFAVVFGTSFIDRCIPVILQTESKFVHWHSRPVTAIRMQTAINSINPERPKLDDNTNSSNDAVRKKRSCCTACQITITIYMQTTVLIRLQISGSWQYWATQMFHDRATSNGNSTWRAFLTVHCQFSGKPGEFTNT